MEFNNQFIDQLEKPASMTGAEEVSESTAEYIDKPAEASAHETTMPKNNSWIGGGDYQRNYWIA